MATVKAYADLLRNSTRAVARKMGVRLDMSSKEVRVLMRVVLGVIAELIKVLVDKGVITDQELANRLQVSPTEEYDPEPVDPQVPSVAQTPADVPMAGPVTAVTDIPGPTVTTEPGG